MKDVKLSGGIQLLDNTVKIKFKKLSPEAVAPKIMKVGDAGADLTATTISETAMYVEYGTGLAVEIPPGYVGYIFPRSSISMKTLLLSNAVGVIDSNYRGEIKLRFKEHLKYGINYWGDFAGEDVNDYEVGDRVGQLIVMPVPAMVFEEVEELSETERNGAGFGSSGK